MDKNKDSKYVHLTYPYDRPGPKKTDPKLNVQKTLRPFNYATPSVKGISEIPWRDIIACTISSGGSSNGAILLQTMEGNFAVKGSSNPALEYFAFMVFKELRIHAPATRILQHTEEEFKLALDYIQKASYADNTLKYKVRQVLDRPFLMLMEYVPFQKIYQLGEKRAKMCFDPAYPDGRDRLIRLGITYAVDTLLNMRDRYPLIWGTAGNPENMLIGFDTNWVTKNEELFDRNNTDLQMTFLSPIDNKPVLIGKKTGLSQESYDLYLEEFEKIVRFAFEGLKPVKEGRINPFDSTTKRFDYTSLASTFIYNQSSHDIKTLGELQILLGLVIGYVNIYNMTFQRIEKMKKRVVGMLKTDWKNLWADDCENIRLDIIKEEMRIIEKYMHGNEDIIGWVSTITLNNYFITFEKLKEDDIDESIVLNQDSFTGEGLSSKNIGEYDEWLEKKVDEYFGITQAGDPRMPQQSNQNPYMNTGGPQNFPAQPNPTPVDQLHQNQASPASPTGKTGKTKGGKSPKSPKPTKGGKSGKKTPANASPTNQRSRSPSPIGQQPGSPSLADSIPQSNQQVGSGAQSNPQMQDGTQPILAGLGSAVQQQAEANPKEEKKDPEPDAGKKKKKKGFFW